MFRTLLRLCGLGDRESADQLRAIPERREQLSTLTDDQLTPASGAARGDADVIETFALAAAIAPIASFYRLKAAMTRHTEASVLPTAGAAKKLV